MKYALENDQKIEANPGQKGSCPVCHGEVIAKCGDKKQWHWAHKGKRQCDPWWENETQWHRDWKNLFPSEWQEIIQFDDVSGEKHIADVKTASGWCVEFQHSFLKEQERLSRNAFYKKLVWLVDGLRRPTDVKQFSRFIEDCSKLTDVVYKNTPMYVESCRLIEEWAGSSSLVFFDFGGEVIDGKTTLWLLFPKTATDNYYLQPFEKDTLVKLLREDLFERYLNENFYVLHENIQALEVQQAEQYNRRIASSKMMSRATISGYRIPNRILRRTSRRL